MIISESNQGGGLHGRSTVEIKDAFFEEVKNALNQKGYGQVSSELHYCDLVDLSGGTSFGGLSVVAMSRIQGRNGNQPYFSSPGEFGLYMDENAQRIFPHHKGFFSKVFNQPRQVLQGVGFFTKYSNKGLSSVVNEIVGNDARVSDIDGDVILTMATTEFDKGSDVAKLIDTPRFAKSHVARGENTLIDSGEEADRKDWLLREVSLATASPSSYLPGVVLHNENRNDYIVAQDGAFSGFNNPSIPVLNEVSFIYGAECPVNKGGVIQLNQYNQPEKSFSLPSDIVHMHWGTGDFSFETAERTRKQARQNTILSMGVANLISAPMNGVHKFSLSSNAASMRHYYNFDFNTSAAPRDIRPNADFTLSSVSQMAKLKDIGQWAADQLSDQIKDVAELVANSYIRRIEYEGGHNMPVSYKEHLRQQSCDPI